MSVQYRAIQWNRFKRGYDVALAGVIFVYLGTFILVGKLRFSGEHGYSDEVLLIRALGSAAVVMLNLTLSIGPLARIDRRFLPLLYNRRHLGVATAGLALLHAVLAVGFYHGFGEIAPLRSLLTSNTQYGSLRGFPFEIPGLVALVILLLLAATSHDFWLKHLTPRWWKQLHRLIYLGWGLVVMHIALGAVQAGGGIYLAVLAGAMLILPGLHIAAALRRPVHRAPAGCGWIDAGAVDDIPDGRGLTVRLPNGRRAAIFRFGRKVAAVSNACLHQGGPLGEGRIIDGCITCPWHGWQYRPETGAAPPPFEERLWTYRLRVESGRVWIDPAALPLGEPAAPALTPPVQPYVQA